MMLSVAHTYNFTRHKQKIQQGCNDQPLHHPPVFDFLPLLGAAVTRVHVQAGAAQAGRGIQQGVIIIRHHQCVHRHSVGRSSGRVVGHLSGDHHLQLVELGGLVVPQLLGEVEGRRVAQVPVAAVPPEGGPHLAE